MPSERDLNAQHESATAGDPPADRLITEVLCRGDCDNRAMRPRTDAPWWLPGIVVVKFRKPLSPELFIEANVEGGAKAMRPWLDLVKVGKILKEFRQAKKPRWTFSYNPNAEPEKGRKQFITFYFLPEAPVIRIAEAFRRVRGVIDAAPEPKLAPPVRALGTSTVYDEMVEVPMLDSSTLSEPLLGEPLAISGGHPLGKAVTNAAGVQNQWYLFRCQADAILATGKSGKGVVVADIDWGFNLSHQDLKGRVEFALNIKTKKNEVGEGPHVSHGTSVLGLLWAGDNDKGMLGFAPGAAVWAIQADDGSGNLDNRLWAEAIDFVRDKNSQGRGKVILIEASTERGGNIEMSMTIREPIMSAISRGAVVCVAAGDAGMDANLLHGNICCIPPTGSILVGATAYHDNPNNIKRGPSNWGNRIDVSAPGSLNYDVTCCSCGNNSYTNQFGGTSGAAAKVAGTIALMLEANSKLTHRQVRTILQSLGPTIITVGNKPIGTFLNTKKAVEDAANTKNKFKQLFNLIIKLILRLFGVRLHDVPT